VARKFWTCPKGCGGRWERTLVKCRTEGCTGRRPKRRVPKHAITLRDDPYPRYVEVNETIHGPAFEWALGAWTPDSCGVCGKAPTTMRHMDRDHDHVTGLPRGLACPGNTGCNALMPRQLTLERARLIVGYLERVEAYYAEAQT
jgi:hypothetical protein